VSNPYIWVTWLAEAMTDRTGCAYRLWAKVNRRGYPKVEESPEDQDRLAEWRRKHEAMLAARMEHWRRLEVPVTLEGQNSIRLYGRTATIAGKPDLIAYDDGCNVVEDTKGGRRKDEHATQVWLYLWLRRLMRTAGENEVGRVIYADREVTVRDDHHCDEDVQSAIAVLIGPEPEKRPSEQSCRFCDVADCAVRAQRVEEVQTDAF